MTGHRYLAFGLRIESAWPIASLAVSGSEFEGPADVEIIEGDVPVPDELEDVDCVKINVDGSRYYLEIPDCGRFQIIGGRKIIAQPNPGATPEQVNLYLLGTVFGTLLHQRRILPFHCNVIELDGSAFLFCGDSGAGKSTLAAYFVDRGYRLLSDDLCALSFSGDGRLFAAPGVPRLRLWQDTLDMLGRSSAGLKLVPWYEDKFEVPLTGQNFGEPLPVAGLYHLRLAESGRPPGIHRLRGLEAANAVTANIYRRRHADLDGAAPFYLGATTRIIDEISIFAMNRRWGFDHFRDEAIAVEAHMRQVVGGDAPAAPRGLESTESRPSNRA
jgi:hypothetical protein